MEAADPAGGGCYNGGWPRRDAPPAGRSPLIYLLLADTAMLLHLLFILFALLGGLLALRRKGWICVHLPAAVWAAAVEFTGWTCPLTPLENWLRARGGGGVYDTGFIERWLVPIIYPARLTRSGQVLLGLAALAVNAAVYLHLWRSRRGG